MSDKDRISGHVIAEISYELDRLVCSCGEVMHAKHAIDWANHRRRLGLRMVGLSEARRTVHVQAGSRA